MVIETFMSWKIFILVEFLENASIMAKSIRKLSNLTGWGSSSRTMVRNFAKEFSKTGISTYPICTSVKIQRELLSEIKKDMNTASISSKTNSFNASRKNTKTTLIKSSPKNSIPNKNYWKISTIRNIWQISLKTIHQSSPPATLISIPERTQLPYWILKQMHKTWRLKHIANSMMFLSSSLVNCFLRFSDDGRIGGVFISY